MEDQSKHKVGVASTAFADEVWVKNAETMYLFDQLNVGIGIVDIDTRHPAYANTMLLNMLGYSPAECEKLILPDDIHPKESLPYVKERFEKMLRYEISQSFEMPMERKDGSIFHCDISVAHVALSEGHYMVGIFVDVSERVIAQTALLDTLNSISDCFFTLDDDMRFTYINKALEELVGERKDGAIGRNVVDAFPEFKGSIFVEKYRKAIKNKRPVAFEAYFAKEPFKGWYDVRVYPKQEGIAVFFQVTTERRLAEKELEKKNIALSEVLEQVQLEKEKMRKDIRDNVTDIVLPIIDKIRLSKPQSKYIDLLKKSIDEITNSFGSRMTAMDMKLTPRELEICSMVKNGLSSKEAGALLNIAPKTVEKHRRNIRKKLGITGKKANLAVFLQSIT